MTVTLQFKSPTKVPVRVQGILPEKVADLSSGQIAELSVWRGNRKLPLGDLFDVSVSSDGGPDVEQDSSATTIVWKGELTPVHWLGAEMRSGRMQVEGDVGRHLGSQMSGGQINVRGSAGDWAGCEIKGGRIDIGRNAGDWLGGAYPGTKAGSNNGIITVGGNAGSGVGFALRRGWICVAGSVERLVGWNMLAGNIVIGKKVGPMAGKGMVRGSLILPAVEHADENRQALSPSFSSGAAFQHPVMALTSNWLKHLGVDVDLPADRRFQLFHGDHLNGGRGEILIANG